MTAPAGSPRWQRRIGFRLALMLAALLLGGYFLLPVVWNLGLRAVGLPTLDQEVVDLTDPAEARLLPRGDLTFIAAYLLAGARPEGAGTWRPDPGRAASIERSLEAYGQTYAWLSADREVLGCSAGLPFEVGDVFDQGLGHAERETAGLPFGDVTLGRVTTPVWKGVEFAGWLVLYGRPPLLGQRGDDPDGVAPSVFVEEKVALRAWTDRVLNLIIAVLVGLTALGLAAVVSRLVTRRVTRLAAQAAAPVAGSKDLPGPFDESGDDEIAVLARAMNGMRARVLELVEDLERRDHDRRRWIAQVSHDLRTPLTALSACLERAQAAQSSGCGEEVSERLEVARHDALRLAELIEDLLDIARLEVEGDPLVEPVPPGELARKARHGLTALAERSQVSLELDLAPHLPLLSADGRRLMRALENLLRNALHHARSRVVLRAERSGDALRFTVEDDGPGLPLDEAGAVDLAGLADRRSRPDSAGLGLVVVRKVAEAHGGRVGAENPAQGGARVWFEIPA